MMNRRAFIAALAIAAAPRFGVAAETAHIEVYLEPT